MNTYNLRRYHLSLSSFQGVVFNASHWYCRIRWTDDVGKDHEADAEHGRGDLKDSRFDTKQAARAAGLRLVKRLASKEYIYYIVTEGSHVVIDPQQILSAPGNLKSRANALWRVFDKTGWDGPKDEWPAVQVICDSWSKLIGEPYRGRKP